MLRLKKDYDHLAKGSVLKPIRHAILMSNSHYCTEDGWFMDINKDNFDEWIEEINEDKPMQDEVQAFKIPLGLQREDIFWHQRTVERFNDVHEAIQRYYTQGLRFSPDWIEEFEKLSKELIETYKK